MTDDYKNTLPSETGEVPASDTPRELHTLADNDRALSRAEADIAGISTTPKMIYGEASSEAGEQEDRLATSEDER